MRKTAVVLLVLLLSFTSLHIIAAQEPDDESSVIGTSPTDNYCFKPTANCLPIPEDPNDPSYDRAVWEWTCGWYWAQWEKYMDNFIVPEWCGDPNLGNMSGVPVPNFDRDGDGIPNSVDLCPSIAGVAPDGCPIVLPGDSDGDGFTDDVDVCPSVVGVAPDGCPLPDGDNDGVPDASDNCPSVANADQANNYGGTAGDACDDSDSDTVLDSVDNCPTTAGSAGGCVPAAAGCYYSTNIWADNLYNGIFNTLNNVVVGLSVDGSCTASQGTLTYVLAETQALALRLCQNLGFNNAFNANSQYFFNTPANVWLCLP